ncbi:AaceriADR212Cp [[Ashbya] aceris (nom. inval.)]|nr:AaceriADR212Cp [[Ashbya] aceris (nom. inval.)]
MFRIIPVTQPTADTKHPLLQLLAGHGDRYFFGKIPEGAQRACVEGKARLSRLNNIFLTGEMDWASIGGLPGMILTASDQGNKNMRLTYGSALLGYVVSTWRYFVFRFGMDLEVNTVKDGETYRDELITVKALNVRRPGMTGIEPLANAAVQKFKFLVERMFPMLSPTAYQDPSSDPELSIRLPKDTMLQISTSYEITFNPVRGKFDAKEAARLGVPGGPVRRELAEGRSITLADGTVIKPEQVVHKQREFARVLILDIPSDEYLPAFVQKFADYNVEGLGAVYYFLGPDVTITSELIRFMELFDNKTVKHFVSHDAVTPNSISFWDSSVTMLKLKTLQPTSYNLPFTGRVLSGDFYRCFEKELPADATTDNTNESPFKSSIENSRVYVYSTRVVTGIEPYTPGDEPVKVSITESPDRYQSWEEVFQKRIEPLKIEDANVYDVVTSQKEVDNFNTEGKRKDIEIMTLGTGSALPSKYRNVISTLLKIPYDADGRILNRNIILDAGENTLGSIHRLLHRVKIPRFFRDLKMIYLSHLHADHHLGIASLLKEWYLHNKEDPEAKIYLVAPWKYDTFIEEWFTLEDRSILERVNYISCEHFLDGPKRKPSAYQPSLGYPEEIDVTHRNKVNLLVEKNGEKRRYVSDNSTVNIPWRHIRNMQKDLQIASFKTCRAIHCEWAYSNAISFYVGSSSKKQFKVSYSGDTRPNFDKFAKGIGKHSDLLIHEATLDNELLEDAKKKRHSTINEAISVSNAMGARKVILTHFSQRYPKAPQLSGNLEVKAEACCYAFDGMIVNYENLGQQVTKLKYLKGLFAEEEDIESGQD